MKTLLSCRSLPLNLSLETDRNTIPADVGAVKILGLQGNQGGCNLNTSITPRAQD